jgi:uncharacterized protein YdeI (YjbR/CyaY-like superfamily)
MEEERGGLPVHCFVDGAAFEIWLEAHGLSAPGIWLRLAKKGAPEQTLTRAEAIDAALCHGWIDGQLDTYGKHYWLIRFTPRKPRSRWSQVNRSRATELVAEGRMRPRRTVVGRGRMRLPVRQRRPPTSSPRLRRTPRPRRSSPR